MLISKLKYNKYT